MEGGHTISWIMIVIGGVVVYQLWTLRSIDKTLKSVEGRMSRVEIRAAQSHELVKAHLGPEPLIKKDTVH